MSSTNKSNKINQLKDAYINSKEGYALFKNPSGSLKSLFSAHGIEITPVNFLATLIGAEGERDKDIWAQAAQLIFNMYEWEGHDADKEYMERKIHEKFTNATAGSNSLWYLGDDNEGEISNLMRESNTTSIKQACGLWVLQEQEKAAIILNEWVNKDVEESDGRKTVTKGWFDN
jgi:hypothetical protein